MGFKSVVDKHTTNIAFETHMPFFQPISSITLFFILSEINIIPVYVGVFPVNIDQERIEKLMLA